MALFGRNKKPAVTQEYQMAEQVLGQTVAFCNSVLEYVDGTSEAEQKMIAEVREKLGNANSLQESLREGRMDPQMCATVGFSLTFNQLIEIVTKLDASNSEERALIDAAKRQLERSLASGYGPALEMQRQGNWPL
ncbi:MAG: hypothetical protein Q3963_05840 [Coriobacteriaceae bacterium]|nr:hypothetical protein [Coriobacteriaceae bacterium]